MCAAPGGKTTHLAALMANQGEITALDVSEAKVTRINDNANRLGVTILVAKRMDAGKSAKAFGHGFFDRVLLDAPCSALGTRPKLCETIKLKELKNHPKVGAKLMEAAVEVLKPGGVLVYSTCTYCPLENEEQVAHALKTLPIELEEIPPELRGFGEEGLTTTTLAPEDAKKVRRFPPSGGTIGFFMARFVKNGGDAGAA